MNDHPEQRTLKSLLACYRVGTRPGEKLLDRLGEAVQSIRKAEALAKPDVPSAGVAMMDGAETP